jgi:hypothetical protein
VNSSPRTPVGRITSWSRIGSPERELFRSAIFLPGIRFG